MRNEILNLRRLALQTQVSASVLHQYGIQVPVSMKFGLGSPAIEELPICTLFFPLVLPMLREPMKLVVLEVVHVSHKFVSLPHLFDPSISSLFFILKFIDASTDLRLFILGNFIIVLGLHHFCLRVPPSTAYPRIHSV